MNRKILLVAATTLFLDQLSKVLIDTFLLLNEEIVIFHFTT